MPHINNTRRLVSCILAGLLLLTLAPLAQAAGAIQITDLTGRKVTVPLNPSRIVCLGPGCLRLIVYLEAQDKVVGIEAFEKRFPHGRPYFYAKPELGKLPAITPGGVAAINNLPDLEGVLKAKPQVVFVTYLQKSKADQLQSLLNIPVVVLSYGPFASFDKVVLDSILLAGRILGKDKRAQALVAQMEAWQKDLAQRGKTAKQRPGAYVGGIGFKGAHGLESTDPNYLPFRWVGAKNLAASPKKAGHVMMDKEQLLALNPEYVFADGGGLALVAADYAKKPEFYNNLKAFQTGRVYVLHPFNWYTTNLGTALADAYAIGKILQPEEFKDVAPPAKADEIYVFLLGKPVYAAMAKRYGPLGGKPPFLKKDK
ncbi:MAG: iron ABC transporter substrate-binding protein [Desulfarculaceae bacterium]|nr:iron ABC transporter substrate-binding protein [Desulfarculaceae bacterium]MCF8048951.1 iron ABC transporter substrate-binding protein [Desulfarculaceae bacterium]MCF8098226.1 iron ABC transporter substrate-binding protein [Desulfarculaceae bacterium]MCF8121554.1 iron ABC transporter substrate-binding protein [Desulfarculaceae bacterium]